MLRRTLLALAVAAGTMIASASAAMAQHVSFTRAAFESAQAAGKPILVDIYAPWCPVCRAQEPILETLQAQPANAELIVFRVDFDSQRDVVRSFHAQRQSTLIAYNGTTETGRSVGDTNAASIARLVASTR
ncbi:thioredoxin family protein [Brevundimonas bacteroides]|uniref:thioredoxin family protein n=1 Tax=Brevundimonas bacteroides TaxID=74311 RepID=UPI000496C9F6|nr:thioredoxin family protein [Brevundimonas bacteroides]